MADYSTLTDDELNRLVAERRGWYDFIQSGMSGYWYGNDSNGDYDAVPLWATDLNAAADLLKDMPGYHLIYFAGSVQRWTVTWGAYGNHSAENAARAIAEVYCLRTDESPTPAMRARQTDTERADAQAGDEP